jgi:starch phosphorylase
MRLKRLGWSAREIDEDLEDPFDHEVFTIGFARRFALYKRSALLFRDLDRAKRLFASRSRPLQIVFAGKPHPEDAQGKAVFEQIAAIAKRKEFRGRVVLLENYDIDLARVLVQGVDLWLNNPRRPLEASGTSGQKVPVNGGLNLSILDGWWCEGFSPRTGWAFGKPDEYADHEQQDDDDADALLRALERDVLPLYYRRDRHGVPVEWFRKVKTSMADLIPRFSTSHMVLEYARRLYQPALENGKALRAAGGRGARELVEWKDAVLRSWPLVHVRSAKRAAGGKLEVEVFLGALPAAGIACRDGEGRDRRVLAGKPIGPGLERLTIEAGSPPLRLYPTHRRLVHPQELGLAIEIVL